MSLLIQSEGKPMKMMSLLRRQVWCRTLYCNVFTLHYITLCWKFIYDLIFFNLQLTKMIFHTIDSHIFFLYLESLSYLTTKVKVINQNNEYTSIAHRLLAYQSRLSYMASKVRNLRHNISRCINTILREKWNNNFNLF